LTTAETEMASLRRFASRRLARPNGQQLDGFLRKTNWEAALRDRPLVPWAFCLGVDTPYWGHFTDGQRLALNHWTYAMMYFRIGGGERFVLVSNAAVAALLRPNEPELAALLDLETEEEKDHLAAFARVARALEALHGYSAADMPVKPLRPLVVSRPFVRFLANTFGADFVATYYFGRGIYNHLGKAFEARVAEMADGVPELATLSRLHTVDENRHMAVSRMMAACAHSLIQQRKDRLPAYALLADAMQHALLSYTFSDRITTGQERAMSHAVMPRMKTLSQVDPALLHATVDAHFDGLTGLERARNDDVPRLNQRLLERTGVPPATRQMWFDLLVSLQRNLQLFPAGWSPGDGPLDDPGVLPG
jgi:hypothetical protein